MSAAWLDPEGDGDALVRLLADHPTADVYHDPAYLLAVAGEGTARVLVVEEAGGRLVLPLILRPVPAFLGIPARDGESPYGYAAPLATGGDPAVLWDLAAAALAAAGVVNAFLRNHPLLPWGDLPPRVRPVTASATVAIPLSEGRDQAFAGARVANHRSQVNRARKLGFASRIEPAPAAGALAGFRVLYERTMDRLGAAEFYRFADAHWHHLGRLGDRLALVTVHDPAGTVHNQALFLRGPRFAHYHLSGRSDDAHNAAGNLLFEAAADWATAGGATAIHLGGGTSGAEDDSLLAYKRRIGRQDAGFRTAGLVADPDLHQGLVRRWAEASGGPPRWFQAYRQPVAR